ncbi:MAG: ABC transporter substrate-binding protein [Alcaligenaceae bacterium]|nr:ABC transporter substrate-binding protein [Alcaligenaceae bacterium]
MPSRLLKTGLLTVCSAVNLILPAQAGTLSSPLPGPAKRIISLSPHSTELLFSAQAGKYLAGVSQGSDFPPAALDIQGVGDSLRPNIELLLGLNPDLIVTWSSGGNAIEALKQAEKAVPVLYLYPKKLADITADLEQIAKLAGTQKQTVPLINELSRIIRRTQEKYRHQPAVPIFVFLGEHPLFTLGGSPILNDVLKSCGAYNIFQDIKAPSPIVSLESIIQRQPKMILAGSSVTGKKEEIQDFFNTRGFSYLPEDIITLPPDILFRPTERLIRALPELCQAIEQARNRYTN